MNRSEWWSYKGLPFLDRALQHKTTDFLVIALIFFSVGLIVFEVTLSPESPYLVPIQRAGDLVTGIFILELSLRYLVAPKKKRYFSTYWVDILAVLPILRPLRFLRALRLLRVFRAGILLSRQVSFVAAVFREGLGEHIIIVAVIFMVVFCASIGLVWVEGNKNPAFAELKGNLWWSTFSLIAGEPIGDLPQTPVGKIFLIFIMLGGLTVFAMFTGVVVAVMQDRLRMGLEVRDVELEQLRDHILICGWNRAGKLIVEELQADKPSGIVVVAETDAASSLDSAQVDRGRLFWVREDYASVTVLRKVGADKAKMAILLADKSKPRSDQDRDARTVLAALIIEKLNQNIFTCAELLNRENETHLKMAGVEEVIVGDEYSGSLMASAAINRGIVSMLNELLTYKYGNQFYKLLVPQAWDGMRFGQAYEMMKEQYDAIPIAVEPGQTGERTQPEVNPAASRTLKAGELLLYISKEKTDGQDMT